MDQRENEPEVGDQVMIDETMADDEKDVIGAKYLKMEKSVCFLESIVFVIEVPVFEHCQTEFKGEDFQDLQNHEDYENFEEVEDVGQECIGSH